MLPFLILLFFIILIFIFSHSSSHHIPSKIWTYWHDDTNLPDLVKQCIEQWRRFHPSYQITVLSRSNFRDHVSIPEHLVHHPNFNDSEARFSDLIRLWVLTHHGGIWVDSSFIIKKSFDKLLITDRKHEFYGYYFDGFTTTFPVIESWCFACKKNSSFMIKWRDEFSQMATYPSVFDYVESRRQMGVDIQKISIPYYLTIHIAAQKILQIDKYPQERLSLIKAEDGPFRYLCEAGWDSTKSVESICRPHDFPIIKIRGDERRILVEKLRDCSRYLFST